MQCTGLLHFLSIFYRNLSGYNYFQKLITYKHYSYGGETGSTPMTRFTRKRPPRDDLLARRLCFQSLELPNDGEGG